MGEKHFNRLSLFGFATIAALTLIACGGSDGGTGSTAGSTATTATTDGSTDGGGEHPITYMANATTEYVIVQDGSNPWVQIKKDKGTYGTFKTTVKDPSGRFAIVSRIGKKLFAYYTTVAETTTVDNGRSTSSSGTVSIMISGVPDGSFGTIRSPQGYVSLPNGTYNALQLRAPFVSDLVGFVKTGDPAGTRFVAFRDLSPAPSSETIDWDYNGVLSCAASAVSLPLIGTVSTTFYSANRTALALDVVDGGSSKTVYAPQTSWLNANDRFLVTQSIAEPGSGGATVTRQSSRAQASLSGTSELPLPAAFSSYSVTTVDAAKKIYRIECTPPPGAAYLKYVLHDPSRIQGINDIRDMTIYVSPGYFASSTTLTTPDLSVIPDLDLYNGTKTTASLVAGYGNRPFSTFIYFRYPPYDADRQPSNVVSLPSLSLGAGIVDAVSRVDEIPIG